MTTSLADEIGRSPLADAPTQRADQWILRNMLFHFALPLERIVDSVLPGHLRLLEARAARMRELIGRLPAEAID